ncbi:MAG TPA: XdhC family protein [Candidatus Sulfotelmatobacter sp.]|nr:XdhC family protein [Candidatus Sulfotelmatobacter sp.]
MKKFYADLKSLLDAEKAAAVATIIESKGATPREVGAKMIILDEGQVLGTVGGGCGEAQILWDAVKVLRQGPPMISRVDLTGDINDLSPTNCGGIMDVFIDRFRPAEERGVGLTAREAVDRLLDAVGRGVPAVLATVVGGYARRLPLGSKALILPDGTTHGFPETDPLRPILVAKAQEALARGESWRVRLELPDAPRGSATADEPALDVYLEVVAPPPQLVVVGAGHIAVPLAKIGKLLEFEVTVLDDRSAFANVQRFPEADHVIAADIEKTLQDFPVTPQSHFVLVTRGHQLDEEALRCVLGRGAGYIGMIGSRRRVREVIRHLHELGFSQELTNEVYAPIGVDIGAETPAEIAVAIAAEIVNLRRGGRVVPLSRKGRTA